MLNFNTTIKGVFIAVAFLLLPFSGLWSQCAAGTATSITVTNVPLTACPGSSVSTVILVTGTAQVIVTAPNGARTFYQRDANYRVTIPFSTVVGASTVGTWQVFAESCCSFPGCLAANASFSVNTSFPITQQPVSQAICSSTTRFSVVANPNGSTLSYQWQYNATNLTNGGQISGATINDLTISNTTSANIGTYRCIITSSACPNSFATNTVTLTNNTPLTVTETPYLPLCNNTFTTLQVTATGGTANQNSFQWYANGSPIPSANSGQYIFNTPANPTSYYCVVSNTGSCNVVTTTANMISFAGPAAITGPTTVQCGSTTITASGAISYRWGDLSTGSTFTTTATGTYRVTATGSNGCTVTLSRNVTVSNPSISVTAPATSCGSAVARIPSNEGWQDIYWDGIFTNLYEQTYTTAGTYQVVASDASGCTASSSFTINNVISLGYTITGGGCQATTITASSGFASYNWTNVVTIPNRPTTTTQLGTGQSIVITSSSNLRGNIIVQATATQGCTLTDSFSAFLVENSGSTVTIAPPAIINCNTPITLTASSVPALFNMTYLWSDGATTAARTANTPGIYSLTATNSANCTYTTSVSVTASTANPNIIQQPTPQTACVGGALSLGVSTTNQSGYQWRRNGVNIPGATSSTFNIAATQLTDAGIYDVVVNGCTAGVTSTAVSVTIDNIGISQQPSRVFIACSAAVPATFSVQTLSPANTYQWRFNGVNISNNAVYSGVNSATLTVSSGTPAELGNYDCVVGFSCGNITSTAAALTNLYSSARLNYQFDNNLTDASGNARNATGTVGYTTDRVGVANTAVSLSGTAAQGITATAANYFGAGNFTVSTWFKVDAYASFARLFDFGSGTSNNNVFAFINAAGNVNVRYYDGAIGSSTLTTPAVVPLNTWTHFAWVQNGTSGSLYINGVMVVAPTNMVRPFPNVSRSSCLIGVSNWPNDPRFRGSFDDFTIFDRGLGANELRVIIGGVEVTQHPVSTVSCSGVPATLSVTAPAALNYQWQLNGINVPNATSSTYTTDGSPSSVGEYRVSLTGACGSSFSNNATVTANAIPQFILQVPASITCANPSVTLRVQGSTATSYSWVNGPANSNYIVTSPGVYSSTATGANGCTVSASVTVTANTTAPTVTIATPATITCAVTQASMIASGASSYRWVFGPLTANYEVTRAGTYTVVGTEANGCTGSASVTVIADNTIANPTITANNNVLSALGNAISYRWFQNGNVVPNATSATFTATQIGNYAVAITGANGCAAVSAPFILTSVGIETLESIGVSVFPNPTEGILFISSTSVIESIELFDMMGKDIAVQSADYTQLNITELAAGMYFLKARLADGRTGYTRILKN